MKNTTLWIFLLSTTVILSCVTATLHGQNTTTINATGTLGSYLTGFVKSNGTKGDGNITNTGIFSCNGWAIFDLSLLPTGADVLAANISFTTYGSTINFNNSITMYALTAANHPAVRYGLGLYNDINNAATVSTSMWAMNGANIKTVDSSGLAILSGAIGGKVIVGFNRSINNQFSIYGYPAAAALQPKLEITYTGAAACVSPLVAPVIAAPAGACFSDTFTIHTNNYPTALSGLSYRWQSASIPTGSFMDIPGGKNLHLSILGQSASTSYRLIIKCSNGLDSAISNVTTVVQNNFQNCYCQPSAPTQLNFIDSFGTFGGSSNISNYNSGYSTGGYGNFTSQSWTVYKNTVVDFSAKTGNANYNTGFAILIDYNHNGTFDDTTEIAFVTNGQVNRPSGTFLIPPNALLGATRMRILADRNHPNPTFHACNFISDGEYEDYTINISALPSCAGLPIAGTASASLSNVCQNTPISLAVSNYTIASGISYQWQQAASPSGTYSNVVGANHAAHIINSQAETTSYRLKVTCANGLDSAFSTVVTVNQIPFVNCYCPSIPNYATDIDVSNVTLGLFSRSSTCDSVGTGLGSIKNRYSNYMDTANMATLYINTPTNLEITTGACSINPPSSIIQAYLDLNKDGDFTDPGEFIYYSPQIFYSPKTETTVITIPQGMPLGITALRILYRDGYNPSYSQICNPHFYGETEDYLVNILPTPSCIYPIVASTTDVDSFGAIIQWKSSATVPSNGYRYEVRTIGLGGSGTVGLAATGITTDTSVAITNLQAATTYKVYVRSLCSSLDSSAFSFAGGLFTTKCISYTLPFVENFTSYPPDICWAEARGKLTNNSTLTVGNSFWEYGRFMNNPISSWSARMSLIPYNSWDEWMLSPSINLGISGNTVLEFTGGIARVNTSTPSALGPYDTFAVVISDDNGATWKKSNVLKYFTYLNTPFGINGQRFAIPLTGYTGHVKIGWYATNGPNIGTVNNLIFVDSIKISNCVNPTVSFGSDTAICRGRGFLISSGVGTAYRYSTGDTTQSILVSAAGIYSVKTLNGNDACFATDTIVVTDEPIPMAGSINYTSVGASFNFTAVGASSNPDRVWHFGDGDSSTQLSPTHFYRANGVYQVSYSLLSSKCGVDTTKRVLTVASVGIENGFTTSKVSLHPNPANTIVIIEAEAGTIPILVQLISATGVVVMKRPLSSSRTEINIADFANGIYTVRINTEKGTVIKRLLILH